MAQTERLDALADARASLREFSDSWRTHLGDLIFDNTVTDLGGTSAYWTAQRGLHEEAFAAGSRPRVHPSPRSWV